MVHSPHVSAALEAFQESVFFGSISRTALGTYRQIKFDGDGQPRPIAIGASPMLVQARFESCGRRAAGELRALLQQFPAMAPDHA